MKRKIAFFAALCLSLTVLSGCATASSSSYDESLTYETAAAAAAPYMYENSADVLDAHLAADSYADGAGQTAAAPLSAEIERKVIKNADITINTLDADKTYNALSAKMTELGGYVFKISTTKNEMTNRIDVTYKIPPENLQAFCDFASETENVSNANIAADDVTGSYYDAKTRLETKRRSLEKYYEYLGDADTAEEMLSIQYQIDVITAEIESFEGQLRVWDSLTTESEIHVYINQTPDPARAELEDIKWDQLSWGNVGTLMANGFGNVLYGLLAVFQWFLIALVSISPILIIAAILGVIIFALKKKFPGKPRAPKKNNAPKQPSGSNNPANGTVYTPPKKAEPSEPEPEKDGGEAN
jgi:hypothetical protein